MLKVLFIVIIKTDVDSQAQHDDDTKIHCFCCFYLWNLEKHYDIHLVSTHEISVFKTIIILYN